MAIIFHITSDAEWTAALQKGHYDKDSLKDEGFIHCCLEAQIEGVLKRYFEGKENLVRLEIETDKLKSPFYYEWSPSTEDTFPHIYGVINLDAIKNVQHIR
jgi:uncharacterized protein (DUF952 family)